MFNNMLRIYLFVGIFQLNVNFLGNFVLFGYDSTSYLLYITEVKRLKNKKSNKYFDKQFCEDNAYYTVKSGYFYNKTVFWLQHFPIKKLESINDYNKKHCKLIIFCCKMCCLLKRSTKELSLPFRG